MEWNNATQAAALVRADIRKALKAGELGDLPDGLKFSVRCGYASLMSEVKIRITAPGGWALTGPATGNGDNARRPTPECQSLADALMAIVGRYYDPDGKTRFATVNLDSGLTLASA